MKQQEDLPAPSEIIARYPASSNHGVSGALWELSNHHNSPWEINGQGFPTIRQLVSVGFYVVNTMPQATHRPL